MILCVGSKAYTQHPNHANQPHTVNGEKTVHPNRPRTPNTQRTKFKLIDFLCLLSLMFFLQYWNRVFWVQFIFPLSFSLSPSLSISWFPSLPFLHFLTGVLKVLCLVLRFYHREGALVGFPLTNWTKCHGALIYIIFGHDNERKLIQLSRFLPLAFSAFNPFSVHISTSCIFSIYRYSIWPFHSVCGFFSFLWIHFYAKASHCVPVLIILLSEYSLDFSPDSFFPVLISFRLWRFFGYLIKPPKA